MNLVDFGKLQDTSRDHRGAVVYLAGGMEYAGDGRSWRERARVDFLKAGIDVWEPYSKESYITDDGREPLETIPTLDKERDFKKINNIMKKVVDYDLSSLIHDTDIVLVKYDRSVLRGAGTHGELSVAAYIGLPVIAWIGDDITMNDIPSWALGCFTEVFHSYEEALSYIIGRS